MMGTYYIYYDQSGRIMAAGMESSLYQEWNCIETDAVLDSLNNYYVDIYVIKQIPPKTYDWQIFDYSLKQWIDPRTLADVQAAQWELMKIARNAAIESPLATPYGTFDCNAAAQANIVSAILLLQNRAALGNPGTVNYTLADNTTISLDVTQMVQVGLLMGAQIEAAFNKGVAKRAAINAATNFGDVQAITWS